MDSQAIMLVSATVVAFTRLLVMFGVPHRYRAAVVIITTTMGIALWAYTQPELATQMDLFGYFTAWTAIATSAAGVYGLTDNTGSGPPPAM